MHKLSPARIFEGFRAVLNRTEEPQRSLMQSYVEGFFCHYALDRTAHPFVRFWQEALAGEQPAYAKSAHTYHFRIESALDTIILRRETGRLIQDFKLTAVLPAERRRSTWPSASCTPRCSPPGSARRTRIRRISAGPRRTCAGCCA